MKHILMIATGGTIASRETADGLTPQLTSEELLAEVPELEQLCRIDTVQLMNRDSTNINSRDWLQMAACVREHYDGYDGFVLTHGTDTMAYTAAALSYLIQNNAKPVVITGSQKSIFNQDTRARKMRTKSYNAFSSIDYPETAILRGRQVVYYIPEHVTGAPEFYDRLDPGVFVLKLIPGIDAGIFDYLKAHYRALVIESFGVGGLPCYGDESFYHAVRDWVQSGRVIVMTTQVPHEGSDMEVYQVGHRAKRELGLIEAYSMTSEAVVTKLMWILGQTDDYAEICRMFQTPVQKDQIY